VPTRDIATMWKHVGAAAATLVGLGVASFLGRRP
jgi:formate dehydrogenase iron-sulfur subunit